MLNAADVMLAMLPLAVLGLRGRNGLATTAGQPDSGKHRRHTANGRIATMLKRRRKARGQKRREIREFRAWLQITAEPLW